MRRKRRKIKFSSRCARCGRRALKWSTGSFDTYCRTCKRAHAAAYMRRRRAEARA